MENKKIDISVIIPLYNNETYIAECMKSILNQDFKGTIECIIVDDCSTDKGAETVEQFIENTSNAVPAASEGIVQLADVTWKLIKFEENKGCSAARNKGIDEAQGEFIAFVDSDDTLQYYALRVRHEAITRYDSNMVIGGHVRVFPHHRTEIFASVKNEGSKRTPVDIIRHHNRESLAYVTTKLFRTEALRNSRIRFDETTNIAEDYLFSLELLRRQSSAVVIPDSGYEHYVKENTLSTKYHKNYDKPRMRVIEIENEILREAKHPKAQTVMEHHLTDYAYHCVRNLFRPGCDLSLSEKSKEIDRIVFKNEEVVKAVKSGKYVYGDKLKGMQRLLVMIGSPMLMTLVFSALTMFKRT